MATSAPIAITEGSPREITIRLLDRVQSLEQRLGHLEGENKRINQILDDSGLTVSSRTSLQGQAESGMATSAPTAITEDNLTEITFPLLDRVQSLEQRVGQLEGENKSINQILKDCGLTISSHKPSTTTTTISSNGRPSSIFPHQSGQNLSDSTKLLGAQLTPAATQSTHAENKRLKTLAIWALMKVSSSQGSAEAGRILPRNPRDWDLRVRLAVSQTGLPLISVMGRISKGGPISEFMSEQGIQVPFLVFRVQFNIEDIAADSLEMGTVPDTLLLPPAVVKQLDDPNAVPPGLRYLSFSWRKCGLVGFDKLSDSPVPSRKASAVLEVLKLMGSATENSVQIWFMHPKAELLVERHFDHIRAHRGKMYKSTSTADQTSGPPLISMAEPSES
ncbi:MAG: hypothetical protein FRX48_05774 [Lasallia pustulata]|uniref:Uncharacterized protein n=1 Tax=Lasallia pustulata TaxID=136370 RepID=A0A5M8PN04_9LECA|nr:MAG: hypothetical protein FRX48_05774 [Lasallia pustulata]